MEYWLVCPVSCSKSQVLHELGFGPTDILIAIIMSVAWLQRLKGWKKHHDTKDSAVACWPCNQGIDLAVFLLLHLLCRLAWRNRLQQLDLDCPSNKRADMDWYRSKIQTQGMGPQILAKFEVPNFQHSSGRPCKGGTTTPPSSRASNLPWLLVVERPLRAAGHPCFKASPLYSLEALWQASWDAVIKSKAQQHNIHWSSRMYMALSDLVYHSIHRAKITVTIEVAIWDGIRHF